MKKRTKLIIAAALAAGAYTTYEYLRNKRIPVIPANTPRLFDIHIHSFLGALEKNEPFDTS